jgi:hypothetical protein
LQSSMVLLQYQFVVRRVSHFHIAEADVSHWVCPEIHSQGGHYIVKTGLSIKEDQRMQKNTRILEHTPTHAHTHTRTHAHIYIYTHHSHPHSNTHQTHPYIQNPTHAHTPSQYIFVYVHVPIPTHAHPCTYVLPSLTSNYC